MCVCIAAARKFHTDCNFWALNSLMLRPAAREAVCVMLYPGAGTRAMGMLL